MSLPAYQPKIQTEVSLPYQCIRFSPVMSFLLNNPITLESAPASIKNNIEIYDITLAYSPEYTDLLPLFAHWLTLLNSKNHQFSEYTLVKLLKEEKKKYRNSKHKIINKTTIIPVLMLSHLFDITELKKIFSFKAAHLLHNNQINYQKIPAHLKPDIVREYYLIHQKPYKETHHLLELSLEQAQQLSNFPRLEKSKKIKLSHYLIYSEHLNKLFVSPFLTSVDLSHNKLSRLPQALQNCINLKYLSLEHNALCVINKENLPLPSSLNSLNIAYNHIDTLDKTTFQKCRRLKNLNLDGNNLFELDFTDVLSNLKILSAQNNKIHDLHNVGVNLLELHVQKNQLQHFDERFFDKHHLLEKVYATQNPLESLPEPLLTNAPKKLKLLTISPEMLKDSTKEIIHKLTSIVTH